MALELPFFGQQLAKADVNAGCLPRHLGKQGRKKDRGDAVRCAYEKAAVECAGSNGSLLATMLRTRARASASVEP